MESSQSALIVGGGMGTAAVGAVIWAVRMLLQRFVDQIDKGFAEIRANLIALSGEVHRNTAQTTGLAAELGSIKARVDQHDAKFDGIREAYRSEIDKLNSRIDALMVARGKE